MARKLEVVITGDARGLDRAYGQAGRATDSFGSKLSGMAKGGAIAAGVAAFAGLAVAIKSSVGAALESEKAQARLDQALKSSGISADKYGGQIDAAIQKTSKLAGLDDEALSDTFAKLARTTGDVSKAMDGMRLAADIARSRNVSLESTTKAVEKAYLGSGSALKRFGVEGKTGLDAVEAAQRKFAGGAEAYGKTAAGAQDRFKVALENVQEQLGAKLLPILTKVMEALTRGLEWLEANGDKIGAAFDKIRPFLDRFIEQIRNIVQVVRGIIEGDWSMVWDGLKKIVSNAIAQAVALLKLNFEIWKTVLTTLGSKALEGLKAGLAGLAGLVTAAVGAGLQAIRDKFEAALAAAAGFGGRILTGIGQGLTGVAQAVADKIGKAIQSVRDAFETAYSTARAFGGRIFKGIEDSMSGLGKAVAGWIKAPINAIIDAINSFKIPGLGSITIAGVTVFPGTPPIDPIPEIPRLAKGGIVTRPTMALLGESGPEAVVPLGRRGSATATTVNVYVAGSVLSERDIVEAVQRGLIEKGRRTGGQLLGGYA